MAFDALIIPADGTPVRTVFIEGDDAEQFRTLQQLVGGYVEWVPMRSRGASAFVNEDGMTMSLPVNPRASVVLARFVSWPGQRIHGDVVIAGGDLPKPTNVPDDILKEVQGL